MRRGAAAVVLLAATLLQVTLAPRLEIAGAFPNLALLIVIGITWQRGVRAGLVAACAGGLLLDLTSAGALGPHVLGLLLGVYATGFWVRNVDSVNALHAAVSTAAATLLYSLALVIASAASRPQAAALGVDLELALAAAAYNAVLAPFAVDALHRLDSVGRAPETQ